MRTEWRGTTEDEQAPIWSTILRKQEKLRKGKTADKWDPPVIRIFEGIGY